MEESEKTKKQTELQKLETLEKSIKVKDDQKIAELLKELGETGISMKKFIVTINTKLSFNLTIENDSEKE